MKLPYRPILVDCTALAKRCLSWSGLRVANQTTHVTSNSLSRSSPGGAHFGTNSFFRKVCYQGLALLFLLTASGMLRESKAQEVRYEIPDSGWETFENTTDPLNAGRATYPIATVGDIDGDSNDDFAIGYPRAYNDVGMVVIFSGGTGREIRRISTPQFEQHNFGASLYSYPDLDRDGRRELLVGSYGYNKSFSGYVIASPLNQQRFFTSEGDLGGTKGGNGNGFTLVGDVNSDGVEDYATAAPAYEELYFTSCIGFCIPIGKGGSIFVWSGSDHSVIQRYYRRNYWDVLGPTLIAIGDITGDGKTEFAMTTQRLTSWLDVGALNIVEKTEVIDIFRDAPIWSTVNQGMELQALRDLDGDGVLELLVGRSRVLSGRNGAELFAVSSGSLFVLPQVANPNAPELVRINPNSDSTRLSVSFVTIQDLEKSTRTVMIPTASNERLVVARGIGDINSDGFPDIIVRLRNTDSNRQRSMVITSASRPSQPGPGSQLVRINFHGNKQVSAGREISIRIATNPADAKLKIGKLPAGLNFESNTRTIRGRIRAAGEFKISVTASTNRKSVKKNLKIEVKKRKKVSR